MHAADYSEPSDLHQSPTRLLLLVTLVSLACVIDGVGQSPPAPTVELQVVPARDNVGRGEPLTLYLYFTNNSNTERQCCEKYYE
jgi:hypothetical protein